MVNLTECQIRPPYLWLNTKESNITNAEEEIECHLYPSHGDVGVTLTVAPGTRPLVSTVEIEVRQTELAFRLPRRDRGKKRKPWIDVEEHTIRSTK